jgi:hypothetical protein
MQTLLACVGRYPHVSCEPITAGETRYTLVYLNSAEYTLEWERFCGELELELSWL